MVKGSRHILQASSKASSGTPVDEDAAKPAGFSSEEEEEEEEVLCAI